MHKIIAAALVSLFAINVAFAQATAPAAKPEAKPAAAAPAKPDAKPADAASPASSCEDKAVGKNGKKLAGAARTSFLKKCEKTAQTAAAPQANTVRSSQKQKMSSCSKEGSAKGLKGAEYKSFVSNCLKG